MFFFQRLTYRDACKIPLRFSAVLQRVRHSDNTPGNQTSRAPAAADRTFPTTPGTTTSSLNQNW